MTPTIQIGKMFVWKVYARLSFFNQKIVDILIKDLVLEIKKDGVIVETRKKKT